MCIHVYRVWFAYLYIHFHINLWYTTCIWYTPILIYSRWNEKRKRFEGNPMVYRYIISTRGHVVDLLSSALPPPINYSDRSSIVHIFLFFSNTSSGLATQLCSNFVNSTSQHCLLLLFSNTSYFSRIFTHLHYIHCLWWTAYVNPSSVLLVA